MIQVEGGEERTVVVGANVVVPRAGCVCGITGMEHREKRLGCQDKVDLREGDCFRSFVRVNVSIGARVGVESGLEVRVEEHVGVLESFEVACHSGVGVVFGRVVRGWGGLDGVVGSVVYCIRPNLCVVSFPSIVRMTYGWWDVMSASSACWSRARACLVLVMLDWSRAVGR